MQVVAFFKGDHAPALRCAEEQMRDAAVKKNFERAAALRDTIAYVQSLKEKQIVSDTSGDNTDVIAIVLHGDKAQAVVLHERGGKLIDESALMIKGSPSTVAEAIGAFLPQYYSSVPDIPDVVLIQEQIDDHDILEAWLMRMKGKHAELRVPERGKKSKLLEFAEKNAQEKIRQQEAKWESAARNIEDALGELRDTLGLPDAPARIEGYDISHLGGTETVGSMVVMIGGKPQNKHYRSFTIRTVKEGDIDDCKALAEVLRRRLRHLAENIGEEERVWKTQGIAFGKALKKEQAAIETIIAEHPTELGNDGIAYKDFVVARSKEGIVAFARFHAHPGGITEFGSLWVHSDSQGRKLANFLTRKMLRSLKKGKVYVTCDAKLEEEYGALGFRHLLHPPPVLLQKMEDACKKQCGVENGVVMMYDALQNKPDVSLMEKPDLLVIDGGKGQLGAVTDVLRECQLNIPAIGLAKREEDVFVPGRKDPIIFRNDSQAKFLLIRLRNEAHRFANDHREKRLSKRTIGSALDDVPGIGPKTKKELLNRFGSVNGIKEASEGDIRQIVSEEQWKALHQKLL